MKAFKGLTEKVRKGEGGFTLIELLIVIIILGILAAVVAFNVAGFLGAGTEETAKTQKASLETAIIASMADASAAVCKAHTATDTSGTGTIPKTTEIVEASAAEDGVARTLGDFVSTDVKGDWTWGTDGLVTKGYYAGGGVVCVYDSAANVSWVCT